MTTRSRAAQFAVIAALSVACTAEPIPQTEPGPDASTVGPSTMPPETAPANAKVVQHAERLLRRVGVTAVRDSDSGHRYMPNASLTGKWRGSPAIVYVAPVSAERSALRAVSTMIINGTEAVMVAPEDSALRPATFRLGPHIWQVTVTRPNGIRSDLPKTRSLIRALLSSA